MPKNIYIRWKYRYVLFIQCELDVIFYLYVQFLIVAILNIIWSANDGCMEQYQPWNISFNKKTGSYASDQSETKMNETWFCEPIPVHYKTHFCFLSDTPKLWDKTVADSLCCLALNKISLNCTFVPTLDTWLAILCHIWLQY